MQLVETSWEKAKRYIPNQTQTLSKRPETYCDGVYPKLLVSAHGCQAFDESGKSYIDYISSLGAIILGYSNIGIDDAVKEAIGNGEILLSLPHPKEGELAEKMAGLIPGLDRIKFFKTGSEATSCAVRVARAYTGRTGILKCGYNGWHDWAMVNTQRNSGIPSGLSRYTYEFKQDDFDSFKSAFNRALVPIAAVIIEPVIYEEPQFLQDICNYARSKGTLVIFDEIVNGLRFGFSGSGGMFGIVPDIACYGKCLGNGYSISALLGTKRNMSVFDNDNFIASGTFSGELIGISAALAVLDIARSEEIWANGILLKSGFNLICEDFGLDVSCIGYAPRTKFMFPSLPLRALFWQEAVKKGIIFGHTNFVTMSHGPNIIQSTLSVCRDALKVVKDNWNSPEAKLECKLPVEPLRS